MAELRVPDRHVHLAEERAIQQFLQERGIGYVHRPAEASPIDPSDEDILQAHACWLKPFMDKNGYRTADVIRVTPATPNVPAIRDKFLREHTHSEDEVRFFV
ncbi:MAG: cupin, partial [Nitrospira sp.]|nr:cupin [Nitrospira sp.]